MPLPQKIPVDITPQNVWAILDSVDSDFEDELADVMEDSDTEFVVEDNETEDEQNFVMERNSENSNLTNEKPHAIVHDSKSSKETSPIVETVKPIHWTNSTKYIQTRKECEHNGKVRLEIHPLDSPLNVFDKLLHLENFLQHLKSEAEAYAAQNGRVFEVSLEELRAFIGLNYIMGYHKVPSLRSFWDSSPSLSVPFIANVMTRERFKEILSNLHFSNNNEALPKDHPNHDRAFKVRWLIDYLNERFLQSVDPEANQSVDEHMGKFKGRNIMRQHIHNKPIK